MVSTASDLTRWDLALFNGQILNANSLQIMLQPAVPAPSFGGDYAMGWIVAQSPTAVEYQHSGDISGYNAENLVMHDGAGRLVTVVILTAADDVGPLPLFSEESSEFGVATLATIDTHLNSPKASIPGLTALWQWLR